MSKLISIVLPTYNGEKYLRKAIESVINQSYKNWELIIVNDCSTDSTEQIALEYAQKDNRIRVISNKINLKLPASLNIGFENAKGEYYTWTSDDNQYKPDAIKIMTNFLETNQEYDLVYCDYDLVNEQNEYFTISLVEDNDGIIGMLEDRTIGACFLYTKEIAKKVGKYDESTFCAEDHDFFCRIVLNGKIKHLNENLYVYLQNSQSLTETQKNVIPEINKQVKLKYALPIMKKLNYSDFQMIKILITNYKKKKQKEWLNLAKSINPLWAYLYLCKPDLKYMFFEIAFYLNILFALIRNKKIMFWGASIFIEEFLKKYNLKNKNILGIIDKNTKKQGQELFNYKVFSPEDIKNLNPDLIIFAIKNNHKKIYPIVSEYIKEKYSKILLSKNYFNYLDDKTKTKKENRLSKTEWHDIYNNDFSDRVIIDIKNKKYPCHTKEILNLVKNNSKCLEIGCGSAMSSFALIKENNVEASVLDYNNDIIQLVQNNANKLNLDIKTICCDAFKETLVSEKFDYIFHAGLLEHFYEEERIKFLKLWKPHCKTMISMVPNAASIAYRSGKAIMEKNNIWPYGLEMPLYTQIPDFIKAGYNIKKEYTIGMEEALSFLEEPSELKNILTNWYNSNLTIDNCHQGYLLVTIGENIDE